MERGLYEELLSSGLQRVLERLPPDSYDTSVAEVDGAERAGVLSEAFARVLRNALRDAYSHDNPDRQVGCYNSLVRHLQTITGNTDLTSATAEPPVRQLRLVWEEDRPEPARPDSPLTTGTLLTGTRLDPSLVSQIRKELETADAVDILCSFIKWGGIRVLEGELKAFTARPDALLRVITTSYLGATDLKAVEFLRALPNTTVRVSYDTHRTRLHAKAYILRRKTGFGSAYIGSANLSQAALTDGLEWTVKVSQYEQPYLWEKAVATFETYWNDSEFEPYEVGDRERLDSALAHERGGTTSDSDTVVYFDLNPYPFQQEILDRLEAERDLQCRDRHLVVAATGTGKTMIAAFDYRRWARSAADQGHRPTLLFVAHREEILKQSLSRFRGVLRDNNFGDLLVGEYAPQQYDHLFVSIQSYNSRELWRHPADRYEYVVIDEFHHAAVASYERLLSQVRPKVLLGLTATPERADGLDVRSYFGGHISAEVRLPDAINRKLLSPFQYFGITDDESANLSGLRWSRGGYRTEDLDRILTGNDIRAQLVIQKTTETVLSVRKCRGLGFCVSIAHAEFMARRFREAGIPAEALSAESQDQHRSTVQERLVRREINFIFVVDLYNEGVDIPQVDTILLLRPTASLTVYLQQLGRGLRLYEGKDCLTVLDFIGQAHKSYRFDVRFRALLDDPTRNVAREIEAGFAHLPGGCSIQLERIAKQYVLDNIGRALRQSRGVLIDEVRELSAQLGRAPTLAEFIDYHRLEPDDVYRRGVSWSRLCAEAGVGAAWKDPDEARLTKGLRRIQHVNSIGRISTLLSALRSAAPGDATEGDADPRALLMSHFSLWSRDARFPSLAASFARLRENTTLAAELLELLALRLEQVEFEARPIPLPFPCPLELHGAYTRDEILAGIGHWTFDRQPEMREGVLHLPELKCDVFLFTLHKSERDYSPTTMYKDYAISDSLIHWQSQSTTSVESPTGQRYIRHQREGRTILLFCREYRTSRSGLSSPFYFVGPAEYVSHEGSRPMSITWRLKYPLPAKLYRRMARLAVG
jgi:superfamily II DNA or RNA helicase